MNLPAVFLFCLLAASPGQQQGSAPAAGDPAKAQASPPQQVQPATAIPLANIDELPISLARIQRALTTPQTMKLIEPTMRGGRPVYRVDVEAAKIDIQALLGKEGLRGNASYGGMTHQEFLDLVTPNDVKGYAAFSNTEGLTVAATSIALKWAVLKAIDQFKKAKDARAREQARQEVADALEALHQARRAAGLEDKDEKDHP